MRSVLLMSATLLGLLPGCGGSGSNGGRGSKSSTPPPTISTKAAQNSALIVSLSSATQGASIYYSVDGSTPTASSQPYESPFLVALNLTVKAIAVVSGSSSTVASQIFSPGIASGTLVWSDEFSNNTGLPAQPDRAVWTYDTGNSGFGNGGVCWNRRISPYRGSTTLFGCLHLGAAENSGFIQLSIWTPGSSRPGA